MHILTKQIARAEKIAALVAAATLPSKHNPLDRFRLICDRERIEVIDDTPLSSFRGVYLPLKGDRHVIGLDPSLEQKHREFVAFHELGHYFLKHRHETTYSEFDANFFAFVSLQQEDAK